MLVGCVVRLPFERLPRVRSSAASYGYKRQDFEPEIALFAKENGLRCYKMVLDNLIKYENKKQLIIFEIGYNQLKPIQKLLKNTGFQLISVEKDISDIPRCIVTKRI